jgi:hypothetical protein
LLDPNSLNRLDWIDDVKGKKGSIHAEDQKKPSLLQHLLTSSIDAKLRVGFSILNLTGQPVRYLQQYVDGRNVIQYINDTERGLLNFVATQSHLKNNKPVEEPFDVQQEVYPDQDIQKKDNKNRKPSGNYVTLQVSGFQWLVKVQVDELGIQSQTLHPILGRVNPANKSDEEKKKFLKLIVEVTPYCGGRMLTLRSVFSLRNNTNHALKIKANRGADEKISDSSSHFILDASADLHLPLTLLHTHFALSGGKSLGTLFVKPIDVTPILEELGANLTIECDYSDKPIDLIALAGNKDCLSIDAGNDDADDSVLCSRTGIITQLCCPVNQKPPSTSKDRPYSIKNDPSNLKKYPPFCYCVEVVSSNMISPNVAIEYNIGKFQLIICSR